MTDPATLVGVLANDGGYSEREVNGTLLFLYDDAASLRRYLVDAGRLEREAGAYRRQ